MSTPNSPPSPTLSVSIVIYRSSLEVLDQTLATLLASFVYARDSADLSGAVIDIVHNDSPKPELTAFLQDYIEQAAPAGVTVSVIEGHGNVGYGRGHNLALLQSSSHYHLILNPDVMMSQEALQQGIRFLAANQEIVALSPAVFEEDGSKQYGCKRFPSVLDFLLRGFAPQSIKQRFAKRLAHYEMQDLPENAASTDVPIISGCFMLFKTQALKAVKGFDERYFLYFEDFDLSLRAHEVGALAYLPTMKIVHLGGNSAKKGAKHIAMFARSGVRFYNTHGWRLL
ncbi:MAG: glycosyltransferase [Gammaproteobacteria bacterium]